MTGIAAPTAPITITMCLACATHAAPHHCPDYTQPVATRTTITTPRAVTR